MRHLCANTLQAHQIRTVDPVSYTHLDVYKRQGMVQLWHVYVLAALQGIINAIDNPVRQAFAMELVGRERLVNAVALNSMLFNGARIIGPALAGLIIARAGSPLAGIGIVPVSYTHLDVYKRQKPC